MNLHERGQHEYEALIGNPPAESLAGIRANAPQLYDAVIGSAFGGTLANPELARAHRQIATVATLAALGGAEPQLALHVRAALRQGITPTELRALAEHVALYAGFPRGLNAFGVIDRVLAEEGVPVPPSLRTVRARDHETVVAQAGDSGPAVLLLHALGLDWRMWEAVMAPLAKGRRVFAYDIRNHGGAAGAPTPFTMHDTAADMVAVLDALGLDRAHVVGLSYGGGIAQTAAIEHPERFESLALLATTDFPFESFEARARAAETDGLKAMLAPSLTRWFTADALAEDLEGVRYARERVLRADPADWVASWRAFETLDVQGRLAELAVPALVLAGELDASTTPEIMSAIASRISGATYEELPGTPHMQTLEQPARVAAALDRFLPR